MLDEEITAYRDAVRRTAWLGAVKADDDRIRSAVQEEVAARTVLEIAVRRLTY
jgi:hypothetical protein